MSVLDRGNSFGNLLGSRLEEGLGSGLSARAEKIMTALERGAILRREGADWMLDGEEVTVAMATLVARDLVRRHEDGSGRLSAPGAAWLRRRAAAGRGVWPDEEDGDGEDGGGRVSPWRAQHLDLAESRGTDGRLRQINRAESPLGWLRRRRGRAGEPLLSDAQFMAGERLRAEFERAGIPQRVTAVWSGLGVGGTGSQALGPTELQMRCRARFERALGAMGPGLSDVALRICCYQEGLSLVEERLGWPARSARIVLGLALDRLCDFYGIGKK